MPIRVEVYCIEGIVTGAVEADGHLRDVLEAGGALAVAEASWAPLDGAGETSAEASIAIDDVVAAVVDEESAGPVHAAWHSIRLEAGPYLIEGELPTMPGFDPGRALTRPTGTFVLLRDCRISLLGRADAGTNHHHQLLVNRYGVDRVDADLMLGFFFPGAHIEAPPPLGIAPPLEAKPDAGAAVGGAVAPTATTGA